MKRLIACLFFLGCCLSPAVAAHAKSVTIKIGHGVPETASLHKAFVKFKEIVEAKSSGEMRVQIFPNQQLGGDRELTEALQLNNVSITAVSANNLAPFVAEFFVFDLFYLFSDAETAYRVLDGEVGKKLLTFLEPVGIKGLGQMENGFRNLTNSKRAVSKPDDMNGVKIRVAENPVQISAWKSLGANPTPMAWGEIFTALQQKTLDGQETSLELIVANRFYEAQKFLTISEHLYSPFTLIASLDFYEGLSPEHRAIVDGAAAEIVPYQRGLAQEVAKNAVETIAKAGLEVTMLTPEQKKAFRDKMADSYPLVRDRAGAICDEILKAAGQ